jgi:hypothetical protein
MAKGKNKALQLLQNDLSDLEPLVQPEATSNVSNSVVSVAETTKKSAAEPKDKNKDKNEHQEVLPELPVVTPEEKPVPVARERKAEEKEVVATHQSEQKSQHDQDSSVPVEKNEYVRPAEGKGPEAWFKAANEFYRDGGTKNLHVIIDEKTANRIDWAENACGYTDGRKSRKLVIAAMVEFFFAHHGEEIQKINERIMKENLKKMKVG